MQLPRPAADILGYLFLALLLAPALAHSFDLTLLTAEPSRWLQWHQNLFEYWKFGAPYALLDAGTFCLHFYLAALGLTPVVAQHLATKIPLIAAGLLDGVLLSRLTPDHLSRRVRSAWLLSPVVLWVAAGQPQVEPLSVACLLLALYFARRRRPTLATHLVPRRHLALAAFVAVIGANFEYFPVAYFVVPVLLCVSLTGRERWEVALRTFVGAVAGLIVGFPEAFLSAADRHSLLTGLAGTQQIGPAAPLKVTSMWYLFAHLNLVSDIIPHWFEIFVGVSLLVVLIAVVRQGHRFSEELATTVVAITIILSIVLEPESLPQFSAIAAMALLLLVISVGVSLWLAVLLPVAGLASWFFQDPWVQFTADVNPTGKAHVWSGIPTLNLIPTESGAVYAFGLLAVAALSFCYALRRVDADVRPRRRVDMVGSDSRRAGVGAIGIGSIISIYLAVLGGQAAIAAGLTGATPRALFDAPNLLYNQPFPLHVKMSGGDLELAAVSKTTGIAAADVRSVISVNGVGTTTRSFKVPARFVHAVAGGDGITISTWAVTLLAHHDLSSPSLTDTGLEVAGQRLAPVAVSAVLPHWEFVTFVVPTNDMLDDGTDPVVGRSGPNPETFLNGPKTGIPYMRVVPLTGRALITLDHRVMRVPMATNSIGLLRVQIPLWQSGPRRITVPIGLCRLADCSTLVDLVQWPSVPWEPGLNDWRLIVLALGATLVSAGIVFATIRISRS